jgi:hypothetical protein
MTESPEKLPEAPADTTKRADAAGRILFLIAGGLLLATMVSCACNPVR